MAVNNAFIIVNGRITRREEISFTIENRAVRFSDGFFESMRAFGLEVPFFTLHYQRIKKAWDLFSFDNPIPKEIEFSEAIARLLKSNKHFGSARIRLTFYRKGNGKYLPEINEADWYIESFPHAEKFFTLNTTGKQVDVYEELKKPIHNMFSFKTNQSLIYTQAAIWAKRNKLDDAFIINEQKNIVEATSSNVFVMQGDNIYTPTLGDGCIEGVMRKHLIRSVFPKTKIIVTEQSFSREILLKADEIFLTNAVEGIQWVVGYKSRRFFNKTSKLLCAALNESLLYSSDNI